MVEEIKASFIQRYIKSDSIPPNFTTTSTYNKIIVIKSNSTQLIEIKIVRITLGWES